MLISESFDTASPRAYTSEQALLCMLLAHTSKVFHGTSIRRYRYHQHRASCLQHLLVMMIIVPLICIIAMTMLYAVRASSARVHGDGKVGKRYRSGDRGRGALSSDDFRPEIGPRCVKVNTGSAVVVPIVSSVSRDMRA